MCWTLGLDAAGVFCLGNWRTPCLLTDSDSLVIIWRSATLEAALPMCAALQLPQAVSGGRRLTAISWLRCTYFDTCIWYALGLEVLSLWRWQCIIVSEVAVVGFWIHTGQQSVQTVSSALSHCVYIIILSPFWKQSYWQTYRECSSATWQTEIVMRLFRPLKLSNSMLLDVTCFDLGSLGHWWKSTHILWAVTVS